MYSNGKFATLNTSRDLCLFCGRPGVLDPINFVYIFVYLTKTKRPVFYFVDSNRYPYTIRLVTDEEARAQLKVLKEKGLLSEDQIARAKKFFRDL